MRNRIKRILFTFISKLFFFLPVKNNKVTFINFLGKGFGCNPKYIAKELISSNRTYDLVWLTNDLSEDFPKGIREVKYTSIKAIYELSTSKVIITNVKNDLRIIKKSNQYVIQTWHAPYGFKYAEKDAISSLSDSYIKESIKNSKQSDLFLSCSRMQTEEYKSSFWCECEILEKGLPRNDVYFSNFESIKSKVYEAYGLCCDKKIMLYAPTFRDDGDLSPYNIDFGKVLEELGNEWVVFVRLHPNMSNNNIFSYDDRIINASTYPDIQELIVACEAMITDYSSTIFDACLAKKRIYVFATDVEKVNSSRGLKPLFFEMPFEICTDNEMLLSNIREKTEDELLQASEELLAYCGYVDNGNASKSVVNIIDSVVFGRDCYNG